MDGNPLEPNMVKAFRWFACAVAFVSYGCVANGQTAQPAAGASSAPAAAAVKPAYESDPKFQAEW